VPGIASLWVRERCAVEGWPSAYNQPTNDGHPKIQVLRGLSAKAGPRARRSAPANYAKIASPVSLSITILLVACFVLYGTALVVEAVRGRSTSFPGLEMGGLVAAFLVLHWSTGFPWPREAFSATTPIFDIIVLTACTVLGTAARYFFYLENEFSWRPFLKPLVVSPIVVYPLLGFVQTGSGLELNQLIFLSFVAFQNGFFWNVVFERAKRKNK
jgi:hypothetical protein